MPRVLIITFCYPPTQVIGSVRPAGLAKYLPQFGWEPLILTPKVDRSADTAGIIETGTGTLSAPGKPVWGWMANRVCTSSFVCPYQPSRALVCFTLGPSA